MDVGKEKALKEVKERKQCRSLKRHRGVETPSINKFTGQMIEFFQSRKG
jgi:hypothetical protein